jgi:hypothetical protein
MYYLTARSLDDDDQWPSQSAGRKASTNKSINQIHKISTYLEEEHT